MEVYTTEEQQVEAIKKWWKDNGKSVVLGLVVGLGGLYAWNYYQDHQNANNEIVSESYVQATSELISDSAEAQSNAEEFIQHHQDNYANLLGLQLAKSYVDSGDLAKAATALREVQKTDDDILQALATLRLARVEIEQNNIDAALTELNKLTSASWASQVEELRGDIEQQKGNIEAARTAYAASILAAENPVVKMKLDNLPHQG